MRFTVIRRHGRYLPAILAVLTTAAIPSTAHAETRCSGQAQQAAKLTTASARTATLCLLDMMRRSHGLPTLHGDAKRRCGCDVHDRIRFLMECHTPGSHTAKAPNERVDAYFAV